MSDQILAIVIAVPFLIFLSFCAIYYRLKRGVQTETVQPNLTIRNQTNFQGYSIVRPTRSMRSNQSLYNHVYDIIRNIH